MLKGITLTQALGQLAQQIEQAVIIVGHSINHHLAIIIAEARRAGHHGIIKMLTHPHFGFDGGERATICTQQLAADYFRFLGKAPTSSCTQLTTVYRRLFQEELSGSRDAMIDVLTCQRIYDFIAPFKTEHENKFLSDIVCLEDCTHMELHQSILGADARCEGRVEGRENLT